MTSRAVLISAIRPVYGRQRRSYTELRRQKAAGQRLGMLLLAVGPLVAAVELDADPLLR